MIGVRHLPEWVTFAAVLVLGCLCVRQWYLAHRDCKRAEAEAKAEQTKE